MEVSSRQMCVCRIILGSSGDTLDVPVHIAQCDIAFPLMGMDVLRKGDTEFTHIKEDGENWLRFRFNLLPEEERIFL